MRMLESAYFDLLLGLNRIGREWLPELIEDSAIGGCGGVPKRKEVCPTMIQLSDSK